MSFPPATEIFQFAGFASCRYGFTTRYPQGGGLPHSEISGSPGARPSPELFAACHVLHRLSVPRHPPDALLVLAHAQPQGRAFARPEVGDQRSEIRPAGSACPPACRPPEPMREHRPYRNHRSRRTAYPCPGTTDRPHKTRRSRQSILSCPLHGHDSLHDVKTSDGHAGPFCRATRADLVPGDSADGVRHLRSHPRLLVGLGRFERPTSRLSGVRSNQLSYRPGFRGRRSEIRDRTPPSGHDATAAGIRSLISVLCPLEGMRRRRPGSGRHRRRAGPCGRVQRSRLRCRAGPAALRKEVIQPQVPLRLPCYDFTPVADLTVDGCLPDPKIEVSSPASGQTNSHGVTGGVYKARERIHRGMLIHDY
jgi:hypothetical protein